MFVVLGITLVTIGLVATIIYAILSIQYIRHHSSELPASLIIGFMVSQIFFNMGMMFYLGYITGRIG